MKKAEIKQKFKQLIANRRFRFISGIVLAVLAALVVFRLFLLVFPVRQFELAGDTHYDINEIVDASKIRSGTPLYAINKSKAEKNIIEGCPYVKSVKIKQKFPNKVRLEIEERVAGWYIQVGTDFYALDYDLKVLLETYQEDDLKVRGLTKLELPELESVIVGEYPSFGNGDELLISETLKIIDSIRNHEIKEIITYLNLQNRFQIKLTVKETFDVNFGDMNDAQTKFAMIKRIVHESEFAGYAGGEINVINPLAHSFRGYFADNLQQGSQDAQANDEQDDS